MDEGDGLGCLKGGPWSVKVFDFIARASARLIISTTNLMFATMCHGTWNYLSEVEIFRPFLYRWRTDNQWLHAVGGWTMGFWIVVHVWLLFLPWLADGYKNVKVGGDLGWPLQVSLSGGNIDAENRLARWGLDDIWRIVWMTLIFGALMPLSRSAWALKKNYSLAMWLHMALGAGVFFDSWRRKTHPHVWFLNTPVVLWYLADKYWCSTRGRVDPEAEAKRIVLDEDYMLLLWKGKDTPKRICDIFWLKRSERVGNIAPRTGEMSHPFTTCSSHDVVMPKADDSVGNSAETANVLPTIEPPIKTDVSWPGHRFSLRSSFLWRHSGDNVDQVRPFSYRIIYGESDIICGFGVGGPSPASKMLILGHLCRRQQWSYRQVGLRYKNGKNDFMVVKCDGGEEIVNGAYHQSTLCCHFSSITNRHDYRDFGATFESRTAVQVDGLIPRSQLSLCVMHLTYITSPSVPSVKRDNGSDAAALVKKAVESKQKTAKKKNMVIKRLPTLEFQEFRKNEMDSGSLGKIMGGGEWDKMAIIKIHRRTASKLREYSCMGYTHLISTYRRTETAHMADLETTENGGVPLRTYGPYRSEYGRLIEFPNLPPLLIIATGAGAALALDFIAYVRANKLAPARPVTICYSSASLALLQFVTNTLLASRIPGIHIKTALTRHDDLELFDTTTERKDDLAIGRLDVMSIMDAASADTEVYFCGGGAVNRMLQTFCAKRGMKYVGSSVQ
ncbi:unnamed protein product [Ascophyllum nodosum]